jgi:hypothetical protein
LLLPSLPPPLLLPLQPRPQLQKDCSSTRPEALLTQVCRKAPQCQLLLLLGGRSAVVLPQIGQ